MSIKISDHTIPEDDYRQVLVKEETEYRKRTDALNHTDFEPTTSAVITIVGLDRKHHDFLIELYKTKNPFSIQVTEKGLQGEGCLMPRPPSSFVKIRSTTIRYTEEE